MSTTKLALEERIAQCNVQTQADIRTLADVIRILGMAPARNRFQSMLDSRRWKYWEGAKVADLAKQLAKQLAKPQE